LHRGRDPPHAVGGGRAHPHVSRRVPRLRLSGAPFLSESPREKLMEAAVPTASPARPRTSYLTELLGARTLCIGGVMIALPAICIGPVQDPDFWWHIRIGQWMAENGRLPSTDIFTFTVASHTWTDHEYLTEIAMWTIYRAAGTAGIAVAFGIVTWAAFVILYRHVRRQPFLIVGLGLGLAALAGYPIWGPRAQMITFALTCLE